tara:strand:- start:64 stop:279 length:216 start_codon:yes stop_codon:yes gene_type:complete
MDEKQETMYWQAVCDKDKNYDGIFFYAVKTTGIFCKPSCASRTPLHKNVEYFVDADSAKNAKYRACLRCKP